MNDVAGNAFREKFTSAVIALVLVVCVIGINMTITSEPSGPDFYGLLVIAILLSQLAIAAVWLVVGKTWIFVRVLLPIVLAEALMEHFGNNTMPITPIAIYFAYTALGTLVMSRLGLIRAKANKTAEVANRRQFSLYQLLTITTVAAILAAFVSYHRDDVDTTRENIFRLAVMCAVLSVMALLGVWTAWGARRWLALRLLLPIVAAVGFPFVLSLIDSVPNYPEMAGFFLMQSVFVASLLLLWRKLASAIDQRMLRNETQAEVQTPATLSNDLSPGSKLIS